MGRVALKISVGFVTGALILLAVSLYLSNRALMEQVQLARAGDVEGAMTKVEWAARLNPFDPAPPTAEAYLEWQQGQTEAAAEAFREAIRRAPADPETYMALGDLQKRQLGDWGAAAESYREALRHNPNAVSAITRFADALWQVGDLEEAKAQYEWLQQRREIPPAGLYNLGKIQMQLGEPEKAFGNFAAAKYRVNVRLESLDGSQEGLQEAQRKAFVESVDLAIAEAREAGGAR